MEPPKLSLTARITGVLMNLSMMIGMVVLASLLGIAGATIFIYHEMGNPRDVALARPTTPQKGPEKADASDSFQPRTAPAVAAAAAVAPAADDTTEWHFAEFSDQVRYIDVTYDEGRKHARLTMHTVLSTPPDIATVPAEPAPVFSDDPAAYHQDSTPTLSDPGSRLITDPRTGRVIGVDGTAGAAAEAHRVQALPPGAAASATLQGPKPEVRVAAPVLDLGRPVFGSEFRTAQVVTPVTTSYLPVRKALPVDPEATADNSNFDARAEIASPGRVPARGAAPVFDPARTSRDNRLPYTNDSFLRRD